MSQKPAKQKDNIHHCHLFKTPPCITQVRRQEEDYMYV